MISKENDPQLLSSLDQVFDVLRSQKKFATLYQQQSKIKSRSIQSDISLNETDIKLLTPSKNSDLLNKSSFLQEDDFKSIYKQICKSNNTVTLSLNELQIFFYELGLTKAYQNDLINNIVNLGFVEDPDEVSQKQFKKILKQLMKENKRLTVQRLRDYPGGHSLNKSHYIINSLGSEKVEYGLMNKNKSFHEGRTTYHLDSDSNC